MFEKLFLIIATNRNNLDNTIFSTNDDDVVLQKETPVEVVTLDPQRQRLRRAATGQEGMKKLAKKNKKRHRKRGGWSGVS